MSRDNLSLQQAIQSLEPGDLVRLYTLDLSPLGIPQQYHFTNAGTCTFQGVTFEAIDVEVEGFEWNGQGTMPQPKIRIANVSRLFSGLALQLNDLIGARLIRQRTYRQFLDDGAAPEPDAAFEADFYTIEQKTKHDKVVIEFTLSASMDQEGRQIPGRQVLRDICMWRYRLWRGSTQSFDYTKATCPYTGSAFFDAKGVPTGPSLDRCGKRVSDCKKRFGENAVLPFGGFPGVARTRR